MRSQKGFVLLQVMLIFAILVVLIAQFQYKLNLQIKRTGQSLFLSQAQVYIDGTIDFAKIGLALDAEDNKTDHLYEVWNQFVSNPVPDGPVIDGKLNDLQGRFNLNWLSTDAKERAQALKGFKRLLTLLDINEADRIATELYQWFDKDSGIDYDYAEETLPYAPSFHTMADVSELMLLKSVDKEQYDKLLPYVSALPADSELNINTAPEEVIMSIASFINKDFADQAIKDRGEKGFSSVSDFNNRDIFKDNKSAGIYIPNLTVSSHWFDLFIAVKGDGREITQRTVLYRDDQGKSTVTLIDHSVINPNEIADDPFSNDEDADDNSDNSSDDKTENE